jgi:hypothetical protein
MTDPVSEVESPKEMPPLVSDKITQGGDGLLPVFRAIDLTARLIGPFHIVAQNIAWKIVLLAREADRWQPFTIDQLTAGEEAVCVNRGVIQLFLDRWLSEGLVRRKDDQYSVTPAFVDRITPKRPA